MKKISILILFVFILNCSTTINENKISLKELTSLCEKITKNKIKITKKIKTSQFDIPYYVTDNKKISKYYNWSPKKNINDILVDTKNWILKYNKLLIKFF